MGSNSVQASLFSGFFSQLLKGVHTVTTILLLSRQNCGEIMAQNLCSKKETLLNPQEEDIKRFSKGEQTSVFSGDISHSHDKRQSLKMLG